MPEAPFLRQWIDVVRRIRLGRTVKAVATMLTTYADPDGRRVFPGVARLSYECELSYTSVKNALRTLRRLGLMEKVGRRGDADEYRLILHEDLLERVNVPTPTEATVEINAIRAAWKGNYQPSLRSTRTPAEDDDGEDLRSTAPTAESPEANESAVNGVPPEEESAVNGSTSLRSTAPTATYQERPLTKTNHSDEDLSTDAAATRAHEAESEDRISPPAEVIPINTPGRSPCVHGKSSRRNKHGVPRCEDCRAQEAAAEQIHQIEQAASTVQVGPSRCPEHGLPAGRCNLCRRGLPGAEA